MTHPCDSLLSLTLVVGKSVYLKICSRIFCMLMTSTIYKYICKQKNSEFQFLQIKRTGAGVAFGQIWVWWQEQGDWLPVEIIIAIVGVEEAIVAIHTLLKSIRSHACCYLAMLPKRDCAGAVLCGAGDGELNAMRKIKEMSGNNAMLRRREGGGGQ